MRKDKAQEKRKKQKSSDSKSSLIPNKEKTGNTGSGHGNSTVSNPFNSDEFPEKRGAWEPTVIVDN